MNRVQHHPEAQVAGQMAGHVMAHPGAGGPDGVPLAGQEVIKPPRRGLGAQALRALTTLRPSDLRLQFRRYLNRIFWVARDGWGRFRHEVIMIVLANFLGVSTAAMSLGGVMLYAKHAESHHSVPIRIGWIRFHVHNDVMSLSLYGGAVALLGIFSGLCMYFTERQIQRVTRGYEQQCAQRVLSVISDPIHRGWQDLTGQHQWQAAKAMVHTRARWTAFAFQDMLRSLLPILTFVFTVAFLVHIDLWLTLLLVPVAVVYLIPLYHINRGVSKNQDDYRQLAPLAQGVVAQGLKEMLNTSRPVRWKREWPKTALRSNEYESMLNAYYSRLLADKRVVLLNTIFFVVCLFALFVFFGVATRLYGRTWTELVSYLVALKLAVGALRHVSGLFLKFSRYFPEYREYSHFIEATDHLRKRREHLASTAPGDASAPLIIRIGARGEWNSSPRLPFPAAQILWLLSTQKPDHFLLEGAAARLEARAVEPVALAQRAMIFVGASLDERVSLLVNALGPSPEPGDVERLYTLLQDLGVWDEIAALPRKLDTVVADSPCEVSPEARFALLAASDLLLQPQIVFFNVNALRKVSREFAQRLFTALEETRIVLADTRGLSVIKPRPSLPAGRVAGVVVMDGPHLIAGGNMAWFNANSDDISGFLATHSDVVKEFSDTDVDDNDDDGDDDDMDF